MVELNFEEWKERAIEAAEENEVEIDFEIEDIEDVYDVFNRIYVNNGKPHEVEPWRFGRISNEELAEEIRNNDSWDDDYVEVLMWRADLLGLCAYVCSDDCYSCKLSHEDVADMAAKKLGVEIW